ncbi:hypothetical protein ZIOFF_052322 [Zingiber officinale]|uniref:NOT transcription complex subunit VIP2 n=1 Tax=Zingiber officinale TaxID=94328 RepID=A0A8J5FLW0_ZINOF|nr:hypothetical protein ZIOFF_052322 [Zingiber officinale]
MNVIYSVGCLPNYYLPIGKLNQRLKALTMRRQSSFMKFHSSNSWSRNSFVIWVTYFFRQFGKSVVRADYLTLRQGFILMFNTVYVNTNLTRLFLSCWLAYQSTLNGSTSNLPYTTLFSGQSAAVHGFHPSGGLQGLHNIHGSFNLPNVPGSLASREAAMGVVPSGGVQQPGGSIPSGRIDSGFFFMQMPHGSGVTNRGGINVVGNHAFSSSNINEVTGSITGISSSSASGNRSSVPGLGVSPVLGNVGPRLTSSVGNIVGSGNMGRSISSGGLSLPGGYSGYQDGIRVIFLCSTIIMPSKLLYDAVGSYQSAHLN